MLSTLGRPRKLSLSALPVRGKYLLISEKKDRADHFRFMGSVNYSGKALAQQHEIRLSAGTICPFLGNIAPRSYYGSAGRIWRPKATPLLVATQIAKREQTMAE